ncbi:peptidoglycan editing factor PgeF [Clostridium botulinum]|uniref:Purine nucleoside phosphorylase n=1 Tax=Clostridium botulinum C/D str. DC5 TaxID=1443128 RepID=A0A0A0IIM5_CLOBO|nr:peptidoglycan editing factor PgeF [Clostridium botulinum]KEI01487.1 laccase [Clostridium botulinum C/D str. BKT75002]KEI07821.1 laccase [Clostridium botulinum C/D str. BKT2873]KGM94122.1 laccase [Clostridium botulinum D str. CCUG 7971]KGN01280.1 laccase [Clostridium botulinum C/D str. DC5]KOC49575.1 laccase [Clostridium botulinum]
MKNFNILNVKGYQFLEYKSDSVGIYFSTSKRNLDFNKNNIIGLENLKKIKEWFNIKDVGYLNQVHSDNIYIYDGLKYDGDAIITNEKGIAIGVFTADCVPVLIYDKKNLVVAAIHSGWKGTLNCIVSKTIDKMVSKYNTDIKDLKVYIGPHNMMCCYEVSEELINTFKSSDIYKEAKINDGRNLSLQSCIEKQLNDKNITKNQIHSLNICTYCSREDKFHSYRRDKEESGRMFSFIFIK